jgi:hypothetical protein
MITPNSGLASFHAPDRNKLTVPVRLRWATAPAGGGGAGGAAAIPDATGTAPAAACAAGGWVDFVVASAAAQAADRAITKDDARVDWVAAQQAAWPAGN